jgi:[ribosomal protein S5]-alanine N-acetyltransferase
LSKGREALPPDGLSDGVVRLRPPEKADVPAIVEACRDPVIARYTTVPEDYDEADAHDWLRRCADGLAAGTDVALLIVDARSGELLGSVGAHEIDSQGRCRMGYWVARGARDRGVATRALRLLSRWLLDELGLARIEVHVEPENIPSRRVAERAGFTQEGLLRSYMELAGRRRDLLSYSLVRADVRRGERAPVE